MEQLTQQVAKVWPALVKDVIDLQAIKDVVADKEITEGEILLWTLELEKMRTSKVKTFFAEKAKVSDLEVQIGSAQRRAPDAVYERRSQCALSAAAK